MQTTHQVIAATFRQDADCILASLIGTLRDIELAQDALADALLAAIEHWSVDGIPPNPAAWITVTARRKAIDRLRRESTLARKREQLQVMLEREGQTGDRGAEEMDDRSILMNGSS